MKIRGVERRSRARRKRTQGVHKCVSLRNYISVWDEGGMSDGKKRANPLSAESRVRLGEVSYREEGWRCDEESERWKVGEEGRGWRVESRCVEVS